ncbi:MAG: phosphatase PAP2 family protein, partial [Endomicrobiia bacterium]
TAIVISIFGIISIPEKYKDADTPDKLYGWEIAARELHTLLQTYPESIILTHKYYSAGQMRFALAKYYKKDIPKIYCLDLDFNQYDFWYKDLHKYTNEDAIFFTEGRFKEEDILKNYPFDEVRIISIVNFRKTVKWPQRKFKFYLLKNFNYEKAKKLGFVQQKYNNFSNVVEYFRTYDKTIFLKINKNKIYNNKIFRILSYLITNLGNGLILVPLIAIILVFIDKEKFLYNLIMFILIITFGGILIQILKFLFDKPRPLKLFSDILQQPINVIGEQLREFGFPSGHTFLAFSTATFLSDRIKKKTINIVVFILAIMVGISRVLVGAHFVSDIIGGSIVGIIFTIAILKIEKELK